MSRDDERDSDLNELPKTETRPQVPGVRRRVFESRAPIAEVSDWKKLKVPGYRLLQPLGEGGMGEVFEAQQFIPVKRRVALKIVKLGMATKPLLARFEAERQALAIMDHSSIAKVYDAGETSRGRPFFAMELVKGTRITDYCDEHRLSPEQRLRLFVRVCDAVQHAHQKGVIHRDLKPSNLLVVQEGGRPLPKVIDFGIAKAIAQPLTEEAVFTAHDQVLGTPEYMSPEQTEMSGLGVDIRSDVYALGVVLYVMLAGALPFDSKELRSAGFDEMRRKIREEEPPRPSTRASQVGDPETIARQRSSGAAQLVKHLRGELDWIVMKALEKVPVRRYQTVSELAADIERYLNHEPVMAARPSALYRLRKLVRRHRVASAALLIVTLLVIGSAMAMGILAARIAKERDRANLEAATAQEVSGFLVELFELADPEIGKGERMTAREILDTGAERIRDSLQDQPLVRARLMDAIGRAYLSLGLSDEAEEQLKHSLSVRRRELGDNHRETAESLVSLSRLEGFVGRAEMQEELAREALRIYEGQPGDLDSGIDENLRSLGWSLSKQDRYEEAEPILRRALAIREAGPEKNELQVAESLFDLGSLLWRQGEYDEAERLLERSVAIHEKVLGPDHALLYKGLSSLGILNWTLGRLEEAEAFSRRALHILETAVGPDNIRVASGLVNLAVLIDARDRPDEAAPALERALSIFEDKVGRGHPDSGVAVANLAWVRYRQGRLRESRGLYREALSIYEKSLGPEHTRVATLLRDYSLLLRENEDRAEAIRMLERSLAIREKAFGPDHAQVADCLSSLGDLYREVGESQKAEESYSRALSLRQAALGTEHAQTVETRNAYAELLETMGRTEEAAALIDGGPIPPGS